ncbi:oleate hydratase [Telmatospirillum sp.]|uniref:oleate hydratase n=1 Tax=Telmatospirillum sp. TaxID=2079197 RepID=UPI00283F05FE|nr:oleate hydratase [Telmatospirillum sp.]MDR3436291.1 oleate hydratase [Telmatospirillum sp.]
MTDQNRNVIVLANRSPDRSSAKVFLVGGGIASLAAAAFLIRDGGVSGRNITILEEADKIGGSLEGAGSAHDGYVLRGGRMTERKYLCTYDLFSSIPSLAGDKTVTQEIFDWNDARKTSSQSRLVRDGQKQTAPKFGLSEAHILTIERLALEPEAMLGKTTIADQFDPAFFQTNFWFLWCSTFAFQPWHGAVEFKRYLVRFAHMIGGFNHLEGVMRTAYNQYDSMVRPLQKWLDARGVTFALNTRVIDVGINRQDGKSQVESITCESAGKTSVITVGAKDFVMITLGSMTEASSLGTMDTAPVLKTKKDGGAWTLWEKIAKGRPEFGHPAVFADHIDQSKWVSFTVTMHDPTFLRIVREMTGNEPDEGGLITFPESGWLISMIIPHQPHFIDQPPDVGVFWGYGLFVDTVGNFVKKPMSACSGREIMTEILGHLRVRTDADKILATAVCIPCSMPFITSQFLPREMGDRPPVVPPGSKNLAFIGQFCELPEDVVFTVEYSIRSAQTAVYTLLDLQREPPAVYTGKFNPCVLYKAFISLHDLCA